MRGLPLCLVAGSRYLERVGCARHEPRDDCVSKTIAQRWRRSVRRWSFADDGQALVETAIALPILLALLIGIFEFASAYRVQQVITNGAREGARTGVLPTSTNGDVTAQVANYLNAGGIYTYVLTTQVNGADAAVSSASTGDAVTVLVATNYRFIFIGPVLRLFTIGCQNCDPGTITLRSRSIMRKE